MNRDADSTATTATTYRACSKLIFREESQLQFVILENVMGLQQTKDGELSDADWIVKDFELKGWSAVKLELEAADYGSPTVRHRVIFIALRGQTPSTYKRIAEIQKLLQVMKIGASSVADVFLDDEGLQQFSSAPPQKRLRPTSDNWQRNHLDYYEFAGIPWPPSKLPEFHESCACLSEREIEVMTLAHLKFPPEDDQLSCLDVNDDIRRHFGVIDYTTEDQQLKNPWNGPLLVTLVGSSHIVVRYQKGVFV